MTKLLRLTLFAGTAILMISGPGTAFGNDHLQWLSWRGPDGNGVSHEKYMDWSFDEKPSWSLDLMG